MSISYSPPNSGSEKTALPSTIRLSIVSRKRVFPGEPVNKCRSLISGDRRPGRALTQPTSEFTPNQGWPEPGAKRPPRGEEPRGQPVGPVHSDFAAPPCRWVASRPTAPWSFRPSQHPSVRRQESSLPTRREFGQSEANPNWACSFAWSPTSAPPLCRNHALGTCHSPGSASRHESPTQHEFFHAGFARVRKHRVSHEHEDCGWLAASPNLDEGSRRQSWGTSPSLWSIPPSLLHSSPRQSSHRSLSSRTEKHVPPESPKAARPSAGSPPSHVRSEPRD